MSGSVAVSFQLPGANTLCGSAVSLEADLDGFLREVEQKAYYMAKAAVGDTDEAMDIVQDAMFTLVRKYAARDASQWRPLFYRILQNRITDTHRRATLRRRFFGSALESETAYEQTPGAALDEPEARSELDASSGALLELVAQLPRRQQQAFLLRNLEGMSVAETAKAMRCSQGSVKTHYSRAVHGMREKLQEHWS